MTRAIPTEALYEQGDIDPGLQPFVDQARADLASLLNVDPQSLTTHAAVLVTWPDASVGCPKPDMRYTQAAIDGSIIELTYASQTYRYHAGGRSGPFLCQTPLTARPADVPGA